MSGRSVSAVAVAVIAALSLLPASLTPQTNAVLTNSGSAGGNSFSTGTWDTCSSPGTQTVTADRDSYVAQGSPTQNNGTDGNLFVESRILLVLNQNQRTLVGFTLPSIPSGCTVLLAKLQLFATGAEGTRTIQAYRVTSSWTETGVTWNNQPTTTGTPATSASGLGWREWTVTTIVQNQYSGTNHGFLLRDSSESASGFRQTYTSREGASNDPELVITFG
jgi:hypothetical protein